VGAVGEQPVLYSEPGSTWWPLAWGPGLAMIGVLLDLTSGSSVQVVLWLPVAVLFLLVSAAWVSTRRRTRSLSLTPATLRQGREELPVADIVEVGEAGPAMGAVVLGGGWLVPNGTDGLPLRLRDGRSVLAWAVDVDALAARLRSLIPGDLDGSAGGTSRAPDGSGATAPTAAPGDAATAGGSHDADPRGGAEPAPGDGQG
jgi:hypothetical protein